MRFYLSILTFFIYFGAFAQEEVLENKVLDSLYREDQFYCSVTYNILQNAPVGVSKSRFSPGFTFGFLRDMPINKSRTFAVALGVGYSLNIYDENLYIYDLDNGSGGLTRVYEPISSDIYYNKNKLSLSYIDIPLEIRWRTSTPDSHKFWRIYAGFKVSYLVVDRYKFSNDIFKSIITKNSDLNKLQYGCYIAAGWNSVNVYAYYSLNPIFKTAQVASEPVKMKTLNIGLMFYIL